MVAVDSQTHYITATNSRASLLPKWISGLVSVSLSPLLINFGIENEQGLAQSVPPCSDSQFATRRYYLAKTALKPLMKPQCLFSGSKISPPCGTKIIA